jgi:hypothetical protein
MRRKSAPEGSPGRDLVVRGESRPSLLERRAMRLVKRPKDFLLKILSVGTKKK